MLVPTHAMLVFVYGTLLRGEPNHRYLTRAMLPPGDPPLTPHRAAQLAAYPEKLARAMTAPRARPMEPRFIRQAQTRPAFRMFDLGAFPAVVAGGATAIAGEVYAVGTETLEVLDRLEGHPRFYQRTPIVLADGTRVETYLLPRPPEDSPEIASGSWRAHQGEP